MAHLWIEELPSDWAVVPLRSRWVNLAFDWRAGRLDVCAHGADEVVRDTGATLLERRADGRTDWYLVAPSDAQISINGLPLIGGLHVMTHRDEIRLDGSDAFFFSTEELARVVGMTTTGTPLTCPRCRQRIEPGVPSVACPACGLWHHQSDDLPCWTYASTCALCPQPTALDAGFQWTPMEL